MINLLYPRFYFYYFIYSFLIGVYLLSSVVLVSAVQQHESARNVHWSPPCGVSLPSIPTPSLQVPTAHRAELPEPYGSFLLAVCFHTVTCTSVLLYLPHPSVPSCTHTHTHPCSHHCLAFLRNTRNDEVWHAWGGALETMKPVMGLTSNARQLSPERGIHTWKHPVSSIY